MRVHIKIKRTGEGKQQKFFLLLFIILSLCLFIVLSFLPKEKADVKKAEPPTSIPTEPPPPPLKETKIVIQQGKTISDILSLYAFSPAEIHKLREEVKPVYDLAKIRTKHEIRIYSSQEGQFISMEYDIDNDKYLAVKKEEDSYKAEIKPFPYEIQVKMIWGEIKDNLISAVAEKNETDSLALSLAEIFAWDIDFYSDLRKGDTFKIIFEKKYLYRKFVDYRNILAAEFTNQEKTFQAFRYTYTDTGESDFFTAEGESLRKEFLKSPIPYARITSRFSYNRLHPIRKVFRPHFGVDYAARVGTPVQATADGTVTFVGWNGASGRMVKIRHKNAYETMYLHLKSYATGIKKGAKVKGGQIVGYVGSSGESTGPHLDYRIKLRGKYINPLAWRFKPIAPLRTEFQNDFKHKVQRYHQCLEIPYSLFPLVSVTGLFL
ncbi:MAG: M23 family metallopeptidase [Acidobacteriota bacterium]|nr:M23 family metallopeptidase [Acidobacteriota bacterium]